MFRTTTTDEFLNGLVLLALVNGPLPSSEIAARLTLELHDIELCSSERVAATEH